MFSKHQAIRLCACVVPFAVLCSTGLATSRKLQKDGKAPSYSVVSQRVTPDEWDIFILTSPDNVVEEKLRKLMRYLFKKYRKPKSITVFVHTHESQLRDLGRIGKTLPNDEDERHPKAVLSRVRGREEISYKIPPSNEWKKIIVKRGSRPAPTGTATIWIRSHQIGMGAATRGSVAHLP